MSVDKNPADSGSICVCARNCRTFFINYLKFLIIKILEGIQAEDKSITPHDNPENLAAHRSSARTVNRVNFTGAGAKIIWNEILSGS